VARPPPNDQFPSSTSISEITMSSGLSRRSPAVRRFGVKRLLTSSVPSRIERDLDDDHVLGTSHAAVRWVCNDLVTFETNEEVEAAVRRNVRVRDQRVLNAVGDPAKFLADLVFGA